MSRWAPRVRRPTAWPIIGRVRFGNLRRLTPISNSFGFDRGQPIDRYYIDDFLGRHAGTQEHAPGVIHGRVLEIGEAHYVARFGDPAAIEQVDVLDVSPDNPRATLVADLAHAPDVPSDAFDCVICTQTLLLIYDLHGAVRTLHRILKPGGTLLATVPGISQVCRPEGESWADHWRFTTWSLRRLLEEAFEPQDVTVEAYGNVLTAAAFLYGLAAEDLKPSELDVHDPNYQLIIAAHAVKAAEGR